MVSTEDSLALKKKGNEAVASHDWLKAIEFYTQAIDLNDKDATFYCNRAQVSPPTHDHFEFLYSPCDLHDSKYRQI